jgi:hypothetical protein
MSETRATSRGRITAIKAAEGDRPARVVYIVTGRDVEGQTRHATLSAIIPAEDFDRLYRALKVGDTAEFTTLTDWDKKGLPVTLLSFSKAADLEPQAAA